MNERTKDLISVTVSDGKYTIQEMAPYKWEALRYGEEWSAFRNSGPDNLHIALAHEVARLREVLKGIAEVSSDIPKSWEDHRQCVTECGHFRRAKAALQVAA